MLGFYLVPGSGSVSTFTLLSDGSVGVPRPGTGVPRPESGVPLRTIPEGNIGPESIPCCDH